MIPNGDDNRLQVDIGAVQDAITIDPDKLMGSVSLQGGGIGPVVSTQQQDTRESMYGGEDITPSPLPSPSLYDRDQDIPSTSLGKQVYDWIYRPEGENDDALRDRVNDELKQLSMDELLQYCESMDTGAAIPEDIKDKLPSAVHREKLEAYERDDGRGMVSSSLIFAADLAQAAAVGGAKGLKEMGAFTYSILDWADNATGVDMLPDTDSDDYKNFMTNWENNLDRWVPDGICPSIVSSVAQATAGMKVFGGIGSYLQHYKGIAGITGAIQNVIGAKKAGYLWTLTKSALTSATAFDPDDGNVFNALDQVPWLQGTFITYLAIDPDDTRTEKFIKNALSSYLSDMAVDSLCKGFKKLAKAVRRTNGEKVNAIISMSGDNVDDAATKGNNGIVRANNDTGDIIETVDGEFADRKIVKHGGSAIEEVVDAEFYDPPPVKASPRGIVDDTVDAEWVDDGLKGNEPTLPQLQARPRDYEGKATVLPKEEVDDILEDLDVAFEEIKQKPSKPPVTNVDDAIDVEYHEGAPSTSTGPKAQNATSITASKEDIATTGSRGASKASKKAKGTDTKASVADAPQWPSIGHVEGTSNSASGASAKEGVSTKSILEECQEILDSIDGKMDTVFTPTHDVINTSTIGHELLKEDGFETFIGALGNKVPESNPFGRAATEFTPVTNEALKNRVKDAMEDITGEFSKLEWLSKASEQLAEGVVKAKALYVGHVKELFAITKKLDRQDLTADVKRMIIDGELTNILNNTAKAMSFFDTISTNTGRALQAHKIGLDDVLTESVQSKIYENMIKNIGKMTPSQKVALARNMMEAGSARNSAKMMKLLGQSRTARWIDAFTTNRINFMLSSPKTHLVNSLSNAFKQTVLTPLDDIMLGWGGFKGGLFSINDPIAMNRGLKVASGIAHNIKEAWYMGKRAFDLGTSLLDIDSGIIERTMNTISSLYLGLDPDSTFGKLIDGYGKATGVVSRALVGADEFFKQLSYRGTLYSDLAFQGMEAAKKKGLTDAKAIDSFVSEYVEKNWSKHFQDAATAAGEVVKGARGATEEYIKRAREATWQQSLNDTSMYKMFQNVANTNPLTRNILPFVRTPSNILDDGIQHLPGVGKFSPAYLFSKRFRDAINAGGKEAEKALAKQRVGNMLGAVAILFHNQGMLTGGPPSHKGTREALYATGWRPYSVKIGDQYISYERVEPLKAVFGTITDACQILDGQTAGINIEEVTKAEGLTAGDILGTVSFAIAHNFVNASYMKGLNDFIQGVMLGDGMQLQKILTSFATSSTIPNAMNAIRQTIDPEFKEVQGWIDAFKNRIPGLSSTLPAKYSWITGEPSMYMGGHLSGVMPIVGSYKPKDSTLEALSDIATMMPNLSRNVMGHRLDEQQFSDYCRLHGTVKIKGKTMLQALEAIVDAHKDTSNDRYDLADAVDKKIKEYRNAAKEELFKLYPELSISKSKNNKNDRSKAPTYKASTKGTPMDEGVKSGIERLASF